MTKGKKDKEEAFALVSAAGSTRKVPSEKAAVPGCIDAFHDAHVARLGFKPLIHGGKDGAHMKKLLATWDDATVRSLIAEFFETRDPRVERSDYSIGAFFSLAQYLMARRARGVTDWRVADNIEAARRASGR